MIEQVHVRGFQALADVTVALGRFTVIVGANASGKSSFLDALAMMGRVRETLHGDAIFGPSGDARTAWMRAAVTHGADTGVAITLGQGEGRVELGWGTAGTWQVQQCVSVRPEGTRWVGLTPETNERVLDDVGMGPLARLQLEIGRLREPTDLATVYGNLLPSGEGFGTALQDIQLRADGSLEALVDAMRRVVPRVVGVRTKRVMLGEKPHADVEVCLSHGDSSWWCPAAHLSEGTLFTLAVLTALHAPARPQILLLDDIERGLHPRAQRELVACLRGLLDADPKLQIVCTTHSPYLLDEVEPEAVRVFQLDGQGHTHVKALSEHPDWARMQGQLSAGEFWSWVGESWVFGDAG